MSEKPIYTYNECDELISGLATSVCPVTDSLLSCKIERAGDLIHIDVDVILKGSFEDFLKTDTGKVFTVIKEGAAK